MFEVDFDDGLTLIEIADGVSVEDIKAVTKCSFKVNGCAHDREREREREREMGHGI